MCSPELGPERSAELEEPFMEIRYSLLCCLCESGHRITGKLYRGKADAEGVLSPASTTSCLLSLLPCGCFCRSANAAGYWTRGGQSQRSCPTAATKPQCFALMQLLHHLPLLSHRNLPGPVHQWHAARLRRAAERALRHGFGGALPAAHLPVLPAQ